MKEARFPLAGAAALLLGSGYVSAPKDLGIGANGNLLCKIKNKRVNRHCNETFTSDWRAGHGGILREWMLQEARDLNGKL